jgi:hypothetical protein
MGDKRLATGRRIEVRDISKAARKARLQAGLVVNLIMIAILDGRE